MKEQIKTKKQKKKQIPITSSSFSSSSSNACFNTTSFLSSGILSFIYTVFPNFTLFRFCRVTVKIFCCCAYLGKSSDYLKKYCGQNWFKNFFILFHLSNVWRCRLWNDVPFFIHDLFVPSFFFQETCRGLSILFEKVKNQFSSLLILATVFCFLLY